MSWSWVFFLNLGRFLPLSRPLFAGWFGATQRLMSRCESPPPRTTRDNTRKPHMGRSANTPLPWWSRRHTPGCELPDWWAWDHAGHLTGVMPCHRVLALLEAGLSARSKHTGGPGDRAAWGPLVGLG